VWQLRPAKQKKRKSWSARTLLKYLLIQVPSWALWAAALILLRRWIDFSWWVILGLMAFLVAKDMVLFAFVWRTYDSEHGERARPQVGALGIVVRKLSPAGYIQIGGELWQAEMAGEKTFALEGKTVRVQDVRGLTLIVEPVPESSEDSGGE